MRNRSKSKEQTSKGNPKTGSKGHAKDPAAASSGGRKPRHRVLSERVAGPRHSVTLLQGILWI
jgi:hypothetical protein